MNPLSHIQGGESCRVSDDEGIVLVVFFRTMLEIVAVTFGAGWVFPYEPFF